MKLLPVFAAALIGLLSGCGGNPLDRINEPSGLEKTFDPNSAAEDLRSMTDGGLLDSVQARILTTYLVRNGLMKSETENAVSTYRELLNKALNAGYDGSDSDVSKEASEAASAALVDVVILADSTTQMGRLVIINISVENISGKTIGGIRGDIAIYDVFEDRIHATEYRMLNALSPGQRHQKVFSIHLTRNGEGDKILDYSGGVPFRVTWEPKEVILL